MACASAAGKDGNTSGGSGLVAAATGGIAQVSSSSATVAGAVGATSASASALGAGPQTGGVINRQARFAMEGVGARVIRGPDWKWGKQVIYS